MKLSELLLPIQPRRIIDQKSGSGSKPDPEIRSIHYRAQDVRPGGLFVAIPGFVSDGHDFIDTAIDQGASAVVVEKPVEKNAVIIEVENTRKALAGLSSRFYGNPSEKLLVIGVTGTNGKTTISFLLESILAAAGYSVGVIGTINYRYGGKIFENPRTTPESTDLQRILSEMLEQGITHVVLEVASHAIRLHRIDTTCMDIGIFTNLTQDHLDFHGDIESYWDCKKQLFTEILPKGPKIDRATAVINQDDPKGIELLQQLEIASISVGHSHDNPVHPEDIVLDLDGIRGKISTPAGSFRFKSGLIGRHNLENILCAVGACNVLDVPVPEIKKGIEAVGTIPGRLERIVNDRERFVYVDYAHTPKALENVLSSLKKLAAQKIICIFGCGGDRDKSKRPIMGSIACDLGNLTIITSDNPRTESPLEIIKQILEGIRPSGIREYKPSELKNGFTKKGFVVEPDREKAISLGILVSRPGDIVLIAGKGHETYQIMGTETIPFDDRTVAGKVLGGLN